VQAPDQAGDSGNLGFHAGWTLFKFPSGPGQKRSVTQNDTFPRPEGTARGREARIDVTLAVWTQRLGCKRASGETHGSRALELGGLELEVRNSQGATHEIA